MGFLKENATLLFEPLLYLEQVINWWVFMIDVIIHASNHGGQLWEYLERVTNLVWNSLFAVGNLVR